MGFGYFTSIGKILLFLGWLEALLIISMGHFATGGQSCGVRSSTTWGVRYGHVFFFFPHQKIEGDKAKECLQR